VQRHYFSDPIRKEKWFHDLRTCWVYVRGTQADAAAVLDKKIVRMLEE